LQPVKISAQLNSKQMSVIASNWRQSQPVKSFVQSNSRQVKRKLKAAAASWNQLKVFTAIACCLSRA